MGRKELEALYYPQAKINSRGVWNNKNINQKARYFICFWPMEKTSLQKQPSKYLLQNASKNHRNTKICCFFYILWLK